MDVGCEFTATQEAMETLQYGRLVHLAVSREQRSILGDFVYKFAYERELAGAER